MLRFTMPDNTYTLAEKEEALKDQLEAFKHDEALKEMLDILEVDAESVKERYNGRLCGARVIETQELDPMASLEDKKEALYPLFKELGFIDINRPLREKNSHVIVLGGSINACKDRTEAAARFIDDTTACVSGLSCYRPVSPVERTGGAGTNFDTEFGAMSESFVRTFGLDRQAYTEDFKSDRNLNSISCIRTYEKDGRPYRIFAAPSSEPDIRRADTGDTFDHYMAKAGGIKEDASYLFVTNNRYCNRQFLQLAYRMIKGRYPGTIDVVGCFADERIVTADRYDPFQYLQDIIAIIDWTDRFI